MENAKKETPTIEAEVLNGLFGGNIPVQGQSVEQSEATELPNASIRLDKMRDQRDEARHKISELEKQLAEKDGKLSVLEQNDVEDDPTEYMTDNEKLMFEHSRELDEKINKIVDVVNSMQTENSRKKLDDQEANFFNNNPQLKQQKEVVVKELLDYVNTKPYLKEGLRSGQINIDEAYGAYQASNPSPKIQTQVKNPEQVFSGGSQALPTSPDLLDMNVVRNKATAILRDKHSTNKAQAVDVLHKDITQNIISMLDK